MKQTRNEGCPGKNCPSRKFKLVMRKPHWREIFVVDERDERGNPAKVHWVSEPVIRCKRKDTVRP